MNILYLRGSAKSLRWYSHYYRTVFREGSRNALIHFDAMEQVLRTHHLAGRKSLTGNSRILVIPRTPFSVIYRLKPDRIEVLSIHDNRSDDHPDFS